MVAALVATTRHPTQVSDTDAFDGVPWPACMFGDHAACPGRTVDQGLAPKVSPDGRQIALVPDGPPIERFCGCECHTAASGQ